ncbi:AAA family ATPase [Colletotrichum plurivorum]|uniref:AAA family ATPase n=1 Tax=Colletotrichum plurivorum TaxID=2175906 RepID=A0A8H6KUF1_9PEZI|nr:AAA family ATPase [Colletotrichum plurivorum]
MIYYDYEGFMNRMDDDDGDFVVEVLVAKPNWHADVEAEQNRRSDDSDLKKRHEKKSYVWATQLQLSQGSEEPPEGQILRIRIRSQPILWSIGALADCEILTRARAQFEFHRPFRLLEDTYEGMKSKLNAMESVQAPWPGGLPPGVPPTAQDEARSDVGTSIVQGNPAQKAQAEETPGASSTSNTYDLDCMRTYVGFLEKVVLPIRQKFQNTDKKTRPRVTYEDIPYLFQPGSLAFMSWSGKSSRSLQRSAAQRVWRMASCEPAIVPTAIRSNDAPGLTIWGVYCVDYNGDEPFPLWATVAFGRFTGEKDITSLECYPLSFHPNHANMLNEQLDFGKLFHSCILDDVKHLYYSGWTFVTGLFAEPLEDEKGGVVQYPEYIDSEIVIDFKETLQSYPKWGAENGGESVIPDHNWDYEVFSEMETRVWAVNCDGRDGSRRYRDGGQCSIVTEESRLYNTEANNWMKQDELLNGEFDAQKEPWPEKYLALLPRRIFAYVFRERRFARLDVGSIDRRERQTDVTLNDIQMDGERRLMIRSAVAAHFRGKRGPSTNDLDMIRGKGRGLVILLHGAPGVGKTATAEAVAAENRRPLFPITCGDLGFTPAVVDKSLRDIFRYAHLWNCVLLLDEADVFLTQRERGGGNLERNALVGVFLRVLEYYSGILFLTTNRVGAIDEAFQSRVHLSLSYPHLSLKDTVEILKSNLSRLPRQEHAKDKSSLDGYLLVYDDAIINFVTSEYERYSKETGKKRGPWNGRQIRNAVQIAAGLALYEHESVMKGNNALPAPLNAQQFQAVAATTSEFEKYLKLTKSADEDYLAHHRSERAAHYDEPQEEYQGYERRPDAGRHHSAPRDVYRGPPAGPAQHWGEGQRGGPGTPGFPERDRSPVPPHPDGPGGMYPAASMSSPSPAGRGHQPPREEYTYGRGSEAPQYGASYGGAPRDAQDYRRESEPAQRWGSEPPRQPVFQDGAPSGSPMGRGGQYAR